MEVTSPGRAVIELSLKQRSTSLIRANDLEGLSWPSKTSSFCEMYRLAKEKGHGTLQYRGFDVYLGSSATGPAAVFGGIAGALITVLSLLPPALPVVAGVGVGLMALSAGTLAVAAVRYRRGAEARRIKDAIERNQDCIRSYLLIGLPDPPDRAEGCTGRVAGQEARLAENGRLQEAMQLRQVHEKLSHLPGDTLKEMFSALILSKDRAIIELVQGPCREEIAETIETLTQVGKLVNPGSVNPVREDADSLVIGGVVLKKKAA